MDETRKQARRAGKLYLLLSLTAPWGLLYVPGRLIVRGDATATADRLRAGDALLRLGIASELFHQAVGVFLVLSLYRLFKAVDAGLARQLVALGALVSVPILFVNVLNALAAQSLAGGASYLSAFDRPQLDALAYLFLRLHGQGFTVASIFWGLWLFPFGLLVLRSGFIPRALGVLLLVAGAGYLVDSTCALVLPRWAHAVGPWMTVLEFGELPIIFWLLLWGAKPQGPAAEAQAPTPAAG